MLKIAANRGQKNTNWFLNTDDSKTKLVLGIILSLTLFLASCGGVDPVVKIGMVAPFEGKSRAVGYDVIYSARLAVREINEAGGINGTRVALVAYDDSTFVDSAESVADALVIDPNIVAVIGHWTPTTNEAAGAIYESAELAHVRMGEGAFGQFDAAVLSQEWRDSYQAISFQGLQPPGLHAATAYDGMQLIFAAIQQAIEEDGKATRQSVYDALPQVQIDGLTGTLSLYKAD